MNIFLGAGPGGLKVKIIKKTWHMRISAVKLRLQYSVTVTITVAYHNRRA